MWRNWQTHKTKDLMKAISCRFKSCHPHQKNAYPLRVGFFVGAGLEPLGIFALRKGYSVAFLAKMGEESR